ncbi:MAG: hypothetical protein IKL65_02415 [Bacilli bacterium]|nr:hypothetical protein [Bacilli bacterium]
MENVKIISDNGIEINVNGIFYVFNSKYYFIYTLGEIDENDYVKLYIVQVCKEVQNTQFGPVDTGYMLGMEISNPEEWHSVQTSITKIVDDKKNNTQSAEIQYLPISMLVNLKIVSKNKFKLMKNIVENDFKIVLETQPKENVDNNDSITLNVNDANDSNENEMQPIANTSIELDENIDSINNIDNTDAQENSSEVIIDYRARFFEEQEKNQMLEEQIKTLNEKLNEIKNIIG